MHLAHRPSHLLLLVILKLAAVDAVRPVRILPVHHNPDIMQRVLAILMLHRLGRMDGIDRPSTHGLRISKRIRLPRHIDPQLLRQLRQKAVRPIMRISQKRNNHQHQQARAHQQPDSQPLNGYRNTHQPAQSYLLIPVLQAALSSSS